MTRTPDLLIQALGHPFLSSPDSSPRRPVSSGPLLAGGLTLLALLLLPWGQSGATDAWWGIAEARAQTTTSEADTTAVEADPSVPALGAANPLVPRGALLLGMEGSSTLTRGFHGPDGRLPVGGAFLRPGLGPGLLPELAVPEARFRSLAETPSDWQLSLGRVRGHMSAAEQHLPLEIAYGVLDRLTLGVTVPMVRRRSNSSLRLSGEGATVGTNPFRSDPSGVNGFLSDVRDALVALETELARACSSGSGSGTEPGDLSCSEGRRLLNDARRFALDLEAAYQEEVVFPLRGTSGGDALSARWNGFRSGLAQWSVGSPDQIPLAGTPLSDDEFTQRFINPVWGEDEGFPRAVSGEDMMLGDVEAHAVLGLLDRRMAGDRVRLRSSAVLSARFATGEPDSLQLLAPLDPPRGTGGMGAKLVSDFTSEARYGLLAVVEGWSFQEAETTVLLPDPNRVFGALGVDRAPVRWTPGSFLRVSVQPRVHITPSLSLGLGYGFLRRGESTFALREPDAEEGVESAPEPARPRPIRAPRQGGATLHHLRGEFRYHGFDPPIAPALRFPVELFLAYEGTLGGSGESALAQRRMVAGVRVLRGGAP